MAELYRCPIYPDLAGKTALIMGIGQTRVPDSLTWGNGAAMARILSHNGVKLFGSDLNIEAAEHTASRLREEVKGCLVEVMTADGTNEEDVKEVVKKMVADERFGRIDLLINNVGMTAPGDPATMAPSLFQAQIDLNLKTVFLSTHAVLPTMTSQSPPGGAIVNNSSLTAIRFIGKPQIGYASAKAAVLQFTRHLAALYGPKKIRANCVVPGIIWTPLVENLGVSSKSEDNEVCKQIVAAGKQAPMTRLGTPEDVANAVAFLCSDVAAGFITGQEVVVDGPPDFLTKVEHRMVHLLTRFEGQLPLGSDPEYLNKDENAGVRIECEARGIGWSLPLAYMALISTWVYSGHFDVPLETLRMIRNGTG